MINKLNIIFIALVLTSQLAFSQLKVLNNGYVGVGTNNPIGNLHVNGRIFLTGNGNTFRILPNNPGTEIGTSTDKIDFWYSTTGYNNLYAQKFYTQSDSTTKENINPLTKGLDKVKQFKSYSYYFKDNKSKIRRKEYGLLAQEVEKVLPELVDTSMGIKLINYNEFIPFIIEAIKEQQTQIETLQSLVYSQEQDLIEMKKQLESCCTSVKDNSKLKNPKSVNTGSTELNSDIEDIALLFDNTPNPFNEDTEIMFYIPENAQNSRLIIHDLQGLEIKSFEINQKGQSSLTISGSELKAGMYLYTLLVDNKIIDTKRMILSK